MACKLNFPPFSDSYFTDTISDYTEVVGSNKVIWKTYT